MLYSITISAILLCGVQYLHAQQGEQYDIVELLDGSKMVGKIIETRPGESITLQARLGTTFTIMHSEIKSIRSGRIPVVRGQKIPVKGPVVRRQNEPSASTPPRQQATNMYPLSNPLNLRIDFEGGYSYRTAEIGENIPPDLKEYVDKMKSGFNIAASGSYFFSEEYGVCLAYSRFMTSNSMSGVYIRDATGTIRGPGSMETQIAISYIGVGLAGRKIISGGDLLFIAQITLGSASYNNETSLLNERATIEASGPAYSGLLALDFMLSRNWALGIGISYLAGTLKDANVNGQSANLGEEGLFRLDFNAGIKFYY